MLKQNIQDDLKKAMLSKDALKTSVLRLILSGITYLEIQKGGSGYQATDEDVISVIQKQAKQRRDSIEQFSKGKRDDLVKKETEELKILQLYLPEQLPEDEIRKELKTIIAQINAQSLKDMGRVMTIAIAKFKGKADTSIISNIVKQELN